jgi:hypothetical protein
MSKLLIILSVVTLFLSSKCDRGRGLNVPGLPSSPGLSDVERILNDQLSGPTTECSNYSDTQVEEGFPYINPARGAWKIMGSKYQSCKILENVEGTGKFSGYQPKVIKKWAKQGQYPENKKCKDARKMSKRKGKRHLTYSQKRRHNPVSRGEIKVFNGGSDCSSFISASFLASGLLMAKNNSVKRYTETTYSIGRDLKSGQSCLERPVSSIKNLLKAGDIVNRENAHVIMIDEVGNDPLGVEKIFNALKSGKINEKSAKKLCSKISSSDMNFNIIHSTRIRRRSSGIQRVTAKKLLSDSTKGVLVAYARNSCAHFIGLKDGSAPFNSKSGQCSKCMVLRHKGKKDPGCIIPPEKVPSVQGEECINDCA